jgi:hypothetical protein
MFLGMTTITRRRSSSHAFIFQKGADFAKPEVYEYIQMQREKARSAPRLRPYALGDGGGVRIAPMTCRSAGKAKKSRRSGTHQGNPVL